MAPPAPMDIKILRGQSLWSVNRAADSLTLQFGQRRTITAHGHKKDVGEYALHIQCSCDFTLHGSPMDDPKEFIRRSGPLHVNDVREVGGNVTFEFAGGVNLRIIADGSSSEEQWRLFRPSTGEEHLVYGSGRYYRE